jgi:hypothetical protein
MGNILCHLPDERPQGILILHNQRQIHILCILPQAVAAAAILGKGVDVGIVPKAGNLQTVPTKHFNRLIGTGSAADMKQCFHSEPPKSLTLHYNMTCRGMQVFTVSCRKQKPAIFVPGI